jgi:GNAT superfamily N-acetyltransferase
MSVAELTSFADDALAGLAHRRLDFEQSDTGELLRGAFQERGWIAMRVVWMRHEVALGAGETPTVEEVPYDSVAQLRARWHLEDFPDQDAAGYHAQAREVALARGVRVLAMHDGGEPVAFAHVERRGASAEITQVYVDPGHRGSGRGTALVRAAIAASADAADLWICADDEDRPKELYARLGFRPVWTVTEFLRLP